MKDRNVQFPNRYKLQSVDGTDDIFDVIPAPGEVVDPGDPINKSNLLPDDVVDKLWATPPENPQVKDALDVLSKAMLYVSPSIVDTLGNLIPIPGDQVVGGVKIATGSYVGTGTYGSGNPNSLTFDFVPKIVIVTYNTSGDVVRIFINPVSKMQGYGGTSSDYSWTVVWGENTVSWYSTQGSTQQHNTSGTAYYYIAIG